MPYKDPSKQRECSRRWNEAHREEIRAAGRAAYYADLDRQRERSRIGMAAWRAAHPEAGRERYAANKEKSAAYSRSYLASHREELKARKIAARNANLEKYRANSLAWYYANPERARESMERARVKRLAAPVCEHPACLALGPVQLALQVNPPTCWICGTPVRMGDNLHVDHVVPLARGGIHCADNLRPACGPCNLRKGARVAA